MKKNNLDGKRISLLTLLVLMIHSLAFTNQKLPVVHQYIADEGAIFSNAYLVELEKGVVVIDATLTNSSARGLKAKLEALGKPLIAVLLTHGHPDHYNGVTELLAEKSVPVYATRGVAEVIKKHDAEKEELWKPVFKDEWPTKRTFPTHLLNDGATLTFEGVKFSVHELGPGESHQDSYWVLNNGKEKAAFIGDVVLNKVHAYFSDGHSKEWLKNIAKLKKELKGFKSIYPGHGEAGGVEILDWQKAYIETYQKNVKELAGADGKLSEESKIELAKRMQLFLPNQKLLFLVGLGADAIASELSTTTN